MLRSVKSNKSWELTGEAGELIGKITRNWLIGLRETNPAILDMFHDRDKLPQRDLLAWSGEFAGKYLTGAYYVYQLTHDRELYDYIIGFLNEFISCIDPDDGYWGCFKKSDRMTGRNSYHKPDDYQNRSWDAWSHYHCMFGTYLWYTETGDKRLLAAVEKAASCFLLNFYNGDRRLIDLGEPFVNLSPIHIFAVLYRETGKNEYLDFCKEIEKDIALPGSGEYLRIAEQGKEFFQGPQPRWESLHTLIGLNELGRVTGDDSYLRSIEKLFYSILRTDVHNTGAFSTNERAVGDPFAVGAVELCCVVAYNALAVEMLKQTYDSRIADHLEISFYNAVMGSFSPSGRWSTYSTPMEGNKCANYHQINFQCRPGSPDLNCCSANSARGLGMFSEWAVLEDDMAVYINSYEAMSLCSDEGWEIRISGRYPACGKVTLNVNGLDGREIALRIPAWSTKTTVSVNNKVASPPPGSYFRIKGLDCADIVLELDFSPTFLDGQRAFAGKTSVYYGPILFGYDASLNGQYELNSLPPVSRNELNRIRPEINADGRLTVIAKSGILLSDFYRLGSNGCDYTTWLNITK